MDAGNRNGAEQFSPVQLNEKELPDIMKRAVIISAALCLSCIAAAADSPDDWAGRDGKPSNLRAGTGCLSVADTAKEFYVFSAKPLPVHPDGKYQAVYESGFSGYSTYYALKEYGIECMIIHAADVPTSQYDHVMKTDAIDSEKLAKSLKGGLLRGIYIRDKEE